MTECYTIPYIFSGGLYTLVSITAISVTIVGFALLYRYRERLKGKFPYVFYGLIGFVLLFGGVAVLVSVAPAWECTTTTSGTGVNMNPGVVQVTLYNVGNLDSMELVGPNGTRSVRVSDIRPDSSFTLRSNEEVINYLDNPENNITVPTISGTKTVESVGELPSEYQKVPAGFVDSNASIGNYDNASVATVACLFKQSAEYEIGGRHIPADVSIPCNTPVLAQNITEDSNVTLGTHVKPSSGPDEGKILTSPVTLRKGEYHLAGIINGQKTVVQEIIVDEETEGEG